MTESVDMPDCQVIGRSFMRLPSDDEVKFFGVF